MSIEITWMIPDKILLTRWIGVISRADIMIFMDEMRVILDNAPTHIHTIMDMAEIGTIAPEALYLYAQSGLAQHPNRGRVAGINATFESEVLLDLMNRLTQRQLICLLPSREAAREYLLQHDTPPPPLTFGFDTCRAGTAPV